MFVKRLMLSIVLVAVLARAEPVLAQDPASTSEPVLVIVEWTTAIAGANPVRSYEIRTGERLLLAVPYRPQLTEAPLSATVAASEVGPEGVSVIASEAPPPGVHV